MNYAAFNDLLLGASSPVVLLEGTRVLHALQAPFLSSLAAHLARTFLHARFRTGNAKGSDDISAARVQEVVAATLEVSPQYQRVAVNYRERKYHPRQRATARLILRDTFGLLPLKWQIRREDFWRLARRERRGISEMDTHRASNAASRQKDRGPGRGGKPPGAGVSRRSWGCLGTHSLFAPWRRAILRFADPSFHR